MQATASTVIFHGLELNTGPSRFKEPLRGFASWIFNDFFKFGRLNVTIIAAEDVGFGCQLLNETNDEQADGQKFECNGIYDQLQKCESDFSLFALGVRNIDHRITSAPFLTGPQTESAEMQLLSYNVTAESNISEIGITKIRWAIFAALTLLLLSIVFVNVLALKVRPLVDGRTRRALTWRPVSLPMAPKTKLQFFGKVFQSLNIRKTHEAYFLLLLLFMLSSAVIIGVAQTFSILKSPPKYFSSLTEAVGNKTYKIILVKGVSANLEDFRKDPEIRDLEKSDRVIWFEREQLPFLSGDLANNPKNRFVIGNKAIIRVTKAFVCNEWIRTGQHVSPGFLNMLTYYENPSVAIYSACIRPELRSRLDTMFQRWMESYLWSHYMEGAAFRVPVDNEEKVFLCIENAPPFDLLKSYKKEMDDIEQPFLFVFFLIVLSTGLGVSSIVYLYEHTVNCCFSLARHRRRQRIRKHLQYARNVHRAWRVPEKTN